MTKKTGSKELDWWHEQPTTVAGVAEKGGLGSTFSGMSLIGIARGTKQSLAESKEEHEARVRRQRGGAVETGEDSIVGISKGLGKKYGNSGDVREVKFLALCSKCRKVYRPGETVIYNNAYCCTVCGKSLESVCPEDLRRIGL